MIGLARGCQHTETPSRGCRWVGNPKLGRWVCGQRKAKKDLDAGSSKQPLARLSFC